MKDNNNKYFHCWIESHPNIDWWATVVYCFWNFSKRIGVTLRAVSIWMLYIYVKLQQQQHQALWNCVLHIYAIEIHIQMWCDWPPHCSISPLFIWNFSSLSNRFKNQYTQRASESQQPRNDEHSTVCMYICIYKCIVFAAPAQLSFRFYEPLCKYARWFESKRQPKVEWNSWEKEERRRKTTKARIAIAWTQAQCIHTYIQSERYTEYICMCVCVCWYTSTLYVK